MKKLRSAVSAAILVLLAVCVAAFALPKLFGAKMFCVLSGSMQPELKPGDLVYAFPAEFDEISQGDIISFVANNNLTVVTHRVAAVNAPQQEFITKGDANGSEDAMPVIYRNVVGVVRFSLPRVGALLQKISTPAGKRILIAVIIGSALVSVLLGAADKNPNAKKKREEVNTDEKE